MPNSLIYRYEPILTTATVEDLVQIVQGLTEELGFFAFHYGAHAPLRADGAKARFLFDGVDLDSLHMFTNFPESWVARYRSEQYLAVDPLVQHCARSVRPIVWHERPQPDKKKAAVMFDEAREHGLATGVTLSIHGRYKEHSICSLCMNDDRQRDKRHLQRQIGSAYVLLVHMHEAVRRLAFPEDSALGDIRLTAREAESLLWVIDGKTSCEIARILGISENTVIYHINNAKRKLDASSRAQAAAKALAFGLIEP